MNSAQKLPPIFYSVGVRIETLTQRLNNLSLENFPTPSGEKLVSLFIRGAQRFANLLERNAVDRLDEIKDTESIEGVVRRIGDSAAILYSYLEYIEAFRFEKTRSEVILPFELLMKEHFDESKNDIFVFYPQWEFNFSYLNLKGQLRKILFITTKQDDDEFFKEMTGRIAIISFPALERDNILALVVLAHELAHYFDIDPDFLDYRISNSPDVKKALTAPSNEIQSWIENWIKASKELNPAPKSWPPEFADILHRSRIMGKLEDSIPFWLRELTADISAARFFGIGFYLGARELFSLIATPIDSPYPPNSKRLAEIAREIKQIEDESGKKVSSRVKNNLHEHEKKLMESVKKTMTSDSEASNAPSVDQILAIDSSKLTPDQRKELLDKAAISIIEQSIAPAMTVVKGKVRKRIPLNDCLRLSDDVLLAAKYLKNYIPPAEKLGSQPIEKPSSFDIRLIFNAVWLRWIEIIDELSVIKETKSEFNSSVTRYYDELTTLSRISLRAIEQSSFCRGYKPDKQKPVDVAYNKNKELLSENFITDKTGVLGKKEIVNLMMTKEISETIGESLVIMPLLDPSQITEASVDLTLGNVFLKMRRTSLSSISFRDICQQGKVVNVFELQERIQLRPDGKSKIVLHPNEFLLGSTLEYIVLPNDVMAYVIGKSSLGRMGLVIATATHVAPGFDGTITLELSNLGSVPLELYPTMLIAQLVFHKLCSPVKCGYSATGAYAHSTGPEPSKYLRRNRRI